LAPNRIFGIGEARHFMFRVLTDMLVLAHAWQITAKSVEFRVIRPF